MSKQEQALQIVRSQYGAIYRTLDAETTSDIEKAAIDRRGPEEAIQLVKGSDSFDWETAVRVLYAAVVVTDTALTIRKEWRERNAAKDPTKEELESELKKRDLGDAVQRVTSKLSKILEAVLAIAF